MFMIAQDEIVSLADIAFLRDRTIKDIDKYGHMKNGVNEGT